MSHLTIIIHALLLITLSSYSQQKTNENMVKKITKTDREWKQSLTNHQYNVLRQKGTDAPGEGGYTSHFEKGSYHCAACDLQLFKSGSKYRTDCGWPSFDDAIEGTVKFVLDKSHAMIRTEIICNSCESHLGHVFNDGPKETTGTRYCVNSTSIIFKKESN